MNRKLKIVLLVQVAILLVLLLVVLISNKGPTSNVSDDLDKENIIDNINDDSSKTNDINFEDEYGQAKDPEDNTGENGEELTQEEEEEPILPEPIVLAFAGDINFDENSKPIARYDRENKGILGAISEDLVEEMNNADIFMLNNEFAYSTRGSRIQEKSYTFRANPKRVDILKEMGVDIVSLANNHALDYGVDALLDTFTTLEEAGIDYVGAGVNIDRAKAPIYYTINDTTIAYVAASRVIYAMDWYASDTRPGMIGTYDPALFVESIKEAKENSDFVVAYVHWGKENTHELLDYQINMAKIYIDAGADAVIGCHPM